MYRVLFSIVFVGFLSVRGQSVQSPCPEYFNYRSDDTGVYGVITLQPYGHVSILLVNTSFTIAARLPNAYAGSIKPIGSEVNLLQDFNRGVPLQYRVVFPVNVPLPKLTSITVNDNLVCYGLGDLGEVTTIILQNILFFKSESNGFYNVYKNQQSQIATSEIVTQAPSNGDHIFENTVDNNITSWYPDDENIPRTTPATPRTTSTTMRRIKKKPTSERLQPVTPPVTEAPPPIPLQTDSISTSTEPTIPLVDIDSHVYARGEWPWLVAIYRRKNSTLTYICTGTLISDRHVITAAHCMQRKSSFTAIEDIIVKAGIYYLEDWADDIAITRSLAAATVHEAYNASTLANDIMVLTLDKPVPLNTYINPICLWRGNTDLNRIVGTTGVVAGWGTDELGRNAPLMVRMPVVSTTACRASRSEFHKLTSSNTFCAGDRNGSGPCTGDSGGGLYILDNGRWRHRGLVSLSLYSENGETMCNLDEYVVFTDSAQYLPWISKVMLDCNCIPHPGIQQDSFSGCGSRKQDIPLRPPQKSLQTDSISTSTEPTIPLVDIDSHAYARGEWPWLVAIYRRKNSTLTYICTGTLLSDRHVITAAHCMRRKSSFTAIEDIIVKAGIYYLEDWADDIAITRSLAAATVHDAYNASTLANDIMVLTLDKPVPLNTYINPICLWRGNTDLNRIVGTTGVVAGWGTDEAGRNAPLMVRMPVVSTAMCRASRSEFHKLTSSNTFCAGDRNGSGPCTGDSGGGLYILDNGRWRHRGLVSLSLYSENGETMCNLDEYVVFTDSAQYLPWISKVMLDCNCIPHPGIQQDSFSGCGSRQQDIPLRPPQKSLQTDSTSKLTEPTIPLVDLDSYSYTRGEWPWLVAIYRRKNSSLAYICTGTLISDRHVITAAHCMQRKSSFTAIEDIIVKAGIYYIEDWADDIAITRSLAAATVHDAYNASTLANDIMVLTLDKPVPLNTYINPICLWRGNTDLNRIVGTTGVVAGWGTDEAGRNAPLMVRMPVVSTAACRASRSEFHKLTSSNTFCAGDRNGSGPCTGDSGGGLYILDNGRWRHRGLVSLSLYSENGETMCNLDEYVVFTDSAQYLPWITKVMLDCNCIPHPGIQLDSFSGCGSRQRNIPLRPPQQSLQTDSTSKSTEPTIPLVDLDSHSYTRGEWPWLVAIYRRKNSSLAYICTGTLISDRHVITAAHCMRRKSSFTAIKDIIVKAGIYYLEDWADDIAITRSLAAATVHDAYNASTLANDIMVLTLDKPVPMNTYINPVCLWRGNTDLNRIVGTTGVVAGWGTDEEGRNAPLMVRMPVVSTAACRASRNEFHKLTSSNTFCAGDRNGSGPCSGDGGGGLYILDNGRWRLRGVVSLSLRSENGDTTCNLDEYIVFTDSAQFLLWIVNVTLDYNSIPHPKNQLNSFSDCGIQKRNLPLR